MGPSVLWPKEHRKKNSLKLSSSSLQVLGLKIFVFFINYYEYSGMIMMLALYHKHTYICLEVCVFEVVQKLTINKKNFHF